MISAVIGIKSLVRMCAVNAACLFAFVSLPLSVIFPTPITGWGLLSPIAIFGGVPESQAMFTLPNTEEFGHMQLSEFFSAFEAPKYQFQIMNVESLRITGFNVVVFKSTGLYEMAKTIGKTIDFALIPYRHCHPAHLHSSPSHSSPTITDTGHFQYLLASPSPNIQTTILPNDLLQQSSGLIHLRHWQQNSLHTRSTVLPLIAPSNSNQHHSLRSLLDGLTVPTPTIQQPHPSSSITAEQPPLQTNSPPFDSTIHPIPASSPRQSP
ncbi:hypothetical protein HNY73_003400 [Argiope bruennichi]|uniref:Uncharacterized protein n=1 Tax=Argiope bruennichi TaxID=94029 RepID=A0A8T0FND3_ARGBR|nr:hypothetical protein HNY73_003400 [Argiope bruennichi]